jgi:hypothetical protein
MQSPEWISKEQVAKELKISERTALSLVGKIKAEKRRNPESNQVVWMFNAVDVQRYAFDRDNRLAVARTSQDAQRGLPAPESDEAPEGSKFIGLTAASKRLGLSPRGIRNAVMSGELRAIDVGETSVALRFHVDELDAFRGMNLAKP